jgi:hypothetical protein
MFFRHLVQCVGRKNRVKPTHPPAVAVNNVLQTTLCPQPKTNKPFSPTMLRSSRTHGEAPRGAGDLGPRKSDIGPPSSRSEKLSEEALKRRSRSDTNRSKRLKREHDSEPPKCPVDKLQTVGYNPNYPLFIIPGKKKYFIL